MKISIITISYNSKKTIYHTMQSVLSQQYDNIEYIVVDGNSTDGTVGMIKRFEPNFKGRMRWISEPDDGIYSAMNKGIEMATGDIIGILNSDDRYKSQYTLNVIARYFKETDCDAVFGDIEFVSAENAYKVVRYWKSSPYMEGGFLHGWHPPHPSFFVKREIYERYGKFDTSFNISADFELMLRFIEKQRIKTEYIPQTLVSMKYGGESTGSLSKILTGNINVIKAFKKHQLPINPLSYFATRITGKIRQFGEMNSWNYEVRET